MAWYSGFGRMSVAAATRFDMLKKAAVEAMSQMSRSEKPAARRATRSASSIFAGVSVKGGWFARNDDATDALYNTTFTLPEILYSDWLQAPEDVVPLVNLVKSLAP